ncbi:hypothetical protein TrLO_g11055 [Triparma laevis f. longispina]|uniref:Uncharacterized protein n=1 Tax=Triparma laevis f. longispina TaxID=1714387 RepID=A0A9W7CJZ5_9STRA|nr:hypothetical protein TrLO_g11055 [Triparma laevis f. longispina]
MLSILLLPFLLLPFTSSQIPPAPHPCQTPYENPHPTNVFPSTPNWECCSGENFVITYSPHAVCGNTDCSKPERKPYINPDATGGCESIFPEGSGDVSAYCFHLNGDNDDTINPQPHFCVMQCTHSSDCPNNDSCKSYNDDWGVINICVGWQYGGYESTFSSERFLQSKEPEYQPTPPAGSNCYPGKECLECELWGEGCDTGKRRRIDCRSEVENEDGDDTVLNTYHYSPCTSTSSDQSRNFYLFFVFNLVLFTVTMLRVRVEIRKFEGEFDRRRREGYTPVKGEQAFKGEREEMLGIEMT